MVNNSESVVSERSTIPEQSDKEIIVHLHTGLGEIGYIVQERIQMIYEQTYQLTKN